MTALLERAFNEAAKLLPAEQDVLAWPAHPVRGQRSGFSEQYPSAPTRKVPDFSMR